MCTTDCKARKEQLNMIYHDQPDKTMPCYEDSSMDVVKARTVKLLALEDTALTRAEV